MKPQPLQPTRELVALHGLLCPTCGRIHISTNPPRPCGLAPTLLARERGRGRLVKS